MTKVLFILADAGHFVVYTCQSHLGGLMNKMNFQDALYISTLGWCGLGESKQTSKTRSYFRL